jgi:hypothetical protein
MKLSYLLISAIPVLFSCKQVSQSMPENAVTKTFEEDTASSERTYEYTDASGKRLIIQNSPPRGINYTDRDGKQYSKLVFWSLITNETDHALDFKIDLPSESFEVPTLPGKFFKALVPPDTMTMDNKPLYDDRNSNLNSYLDGHVHEASSIHRTVNPKESTGFYMALLFDIGVPGPTRTALSIKGQNLIYTVARYDGTPAHALVDKKEIICGSINFEKSTPHEVSITVLPSPPTFCLQLSDRTNRQ